MKELRTVYQSARPLSIDMSSPSPEECDAASELLSNAPLQIRDNNLYPSEL